MFSTKLTGSAILALLLSTVAYGPAAAFQEAPMLAEKVAKGELPPVDQRLPKKPTVLPSASIGQYGGTWHRAYKGPGDRWGPTKLMEERVLKFQQGTDGKLHLIPGYIESYSVNADATAYTFTLLEGLKWSDGHPVTTEDVKFWHQDVFLNPDIIPKFENIYAPGGVPMALEVADARTFTIKFAQPYVFFLEILAKDSTGEPSLDRPSFIMPAHYLKQFLPKYTPLDALNKVAATKGAKKWQDLWGSKGLITAWNQNPDLPVITAWKVSVPPPANVMVMERNPYYYAVDAKGNQLPYIDRVEHKLFDNQETFNLMVIQGQIDMQQRFMNTGDFTLYKENEAKGKYRVLKWKNAETWSLIPNYNSKDETFRALLEDMRVRQALHIAIDRETINELSFAGLGEARQASPVTGSPYYDAAFESKWTQYDPKLANKLLDEAGLTKRDADGFRLRPDGKRFAIVVQAVDASYASILELVRTTWKEVGIELQARIIDRTLFDANRDNNDFDMQYTSFDRSSIVPADPRLYLGKDGYAHQYYTWWDTKGTAGIEPPANYPLRKAWAAWEKALTASTRQAADAAVMEMLGVIRDNTWVIGLVGETPALVAASNRLQNVADGLTNDDTTRGEGLAYPQQFYISQK